MRLLTDQLLIDFLKIQGPKFSLYLALLEQHDSLSARDRQYLHWLEDDPGLQLAQQIGDWWTEKKAATTSEGK